MRIAACLLAVAVASLTSLTQCASGPVENTRAKPAPVSRMVSLPANPSDYEELCLPDLEEVLKQAGFNPVRRAGGAYQLVLHVAGTLGAAEPAATSTVAAGPTGEPQTGRKGLSLALPGGPLRCVVTVALRQGARTVAAAEGKFEGPRAHFTADRVVQGALQKCLGTFSARLAAANEMGAGQSVQMDTAHDD